MASLFISHSVGDSDALIAVAKQLIKKCPDQQIIVLTIGKAAENKWQALLLSKPELKTIIIKTLQQELQAKVELESLKNDIFENFKTTIIDPILTENEIENVLIGTPSQNKAGLVFQIAEYLTTRITGSKLFIYNDYLFKEPAHIFWEQLSKEWSANINFLAPLPKAKTEMCEHNPSINVDIVGHPVFDWPKPSTDHDLRSKLEVTQADTLLFISGSKDLEKDKILLESLLETLEKEQNCNVQIRMGMHPAVDKPENYVKEIIKCAKNFSFSNKQFKLLITPKLNTQFSEDYKDYLITAEENGNTIIDRAADAVVSPSPATLINQAISQNKYAVYTEKTAYIESSKLYNNIAKFFKSVSEKDATQQPLTRSELGIPEESFTETMVNKLVC